MQGSLTNCGLVPLQCERALGQRTQGIERREGARQAGERGDEGLQLIEQLFEQPLLAGQGALLGRQRLVFKGLELGRDEALGVFERLAAAVVVGHLARLALRDFDVEAVHLVELHAQVG